MKQDLAEADAIADSSTRYWPGLRNKPDLESGGGPWAAAMPSDVCYRWTMNFCEEEKPSPRKRGMTCRWT
jgi:hypothetical protein